MATRISSSSSFGVHLIQRRGPAALLLSSRSGPSWTASKPWFWIRRRRSGVALCCAEVGYKVKRKCSKFLEEREIAGITTVSGSGSHEWESVPDIWRTSAQKYGDRVAVLDPYHDPPSKLTYKQLEEEIFNFAEGLRQIGTLPEEKISLFADNSSRWLVADQGIMVTGAINVVRGARSTDEELFQIYTHSESVGLIVDDPKFLKRLADSLIPRVKVRYVVLLWDDKLNASENVAMKDIPFYTYNEITELGKEKRHFLVESLDEGKKIEFEPIKPDDVATLMYTSGTSGMPKGVMLTHRNILHQINNLWEVVPCQVGDRFLSMLPSWHAYERACEYFIFTHGIEQVYTNVNYLKQDLKQYQPQYLISVPLVYETLYSSIQKQISASSTGRKLVALTLIKISLLYMEAKRIYEGKALSKNPREPPLFFCILDWLFARLVAVTLFPLHFLAKKLLYSKIHSAIGISKAGISGGGSLPMHIDKFFEAIGVKVQNGYGLTETSPVAACRRPDCNVLGTVGPPMKHTEIKIVEIETGELVTDGLKGIVKIRGPQVMKGYYKNKTSTEAALDRDGWFNTGDIGWIAPKHAIGRSSLCGGMLVLEGRAKDTIVLTTGENVEPAEIEEAAMRSSLIQQIVVIGQDQRRLGAIVVPNKDEVISIFLEKKEELTNEKVLKLLNEEVRTWTAGCAFQIGPILVVDEPFRVDNGLMTPTMKVRRDKVTAQYSDQITKMYK
ncbi:Long-chain-fatty-acid--CoA ligase FadD15 [Rhynchospora pubera]|uniref:4-coumarate--CoA ligase n=1 Tax=Rhynchospora pubera TaxID=906938 RepID=A0AAV8ATI4_9POAL|nr:Long-chain-fatty-acid--CoA ligase FadD15 [Rhynchospora pubera]KAJ4757134.1 Long-chain-fatty-acid--CoA ligase FadD15 [Rhynchospora pubera]